MTNPIRILIVEDTPADADLMVMHLSWEGFKVDYLRVETEEAFLAALETSYDLILSDWSLPQFNGLRALQRMQEQGLDIPFIIVSGGIGEETAVATMRQGASDYLLKDRMDRLGQAVKHALEQKSLKDEYRKATEALAASEAELRALFTSMQDVVLVLDREGMYRKIAPTKPDLLVRPAEELLGKNLYDIFPLNKALEFTQVIQKVLDTQQIQTIEYELSIKGKQLWFETVVSPLSNQEVIWVARDVSERKQAEAQINLQAAALASAANAIVITDRSGIIDWVNPAYTSLTGYSADEVIGQNPRILKSGVQDQEFYRNLWSTILAGHVWHNELVNKRKDGSLYDEEETITPLRNTQGEIIQFIGIKQDITQRKQTEAALLKHLQRQAQIAAFGRELANTRDLPTICKTSYRMLKQMTGCAYFAITLMEGEEHSLKMLYAALEDTDFDINLYPFLDLGSNFTASVYAQAIQTRRPLIISDLSAIRTGPVGMLDHSGQDMRSACCLPMMAEDQVIGLVELQSPGEEVYLPEDLEWLSVIANQVGLSIQNARLFVETQQRIAELSTLAIIDSAVISHLEPQEMYEIFLEQVRTRLTVDAAVLFLFNSQNQILECVSEAGYCNKAILQMRLHLGESLAGKVALDQQILHQNLDVPQNADLLKEESKPEGFKDYFGVPLVVNSQLIGVLEVLHRSRLAPDPNWLRFLKILANQAAIAINTIQLYDDIQVSHNELLKAYDLTIEGWSRAMDLRDKETENHTRRVTELTLRLAERLGVAEDKIVHIRRGALLHDIGKLGVPDNILSKVDSLSEEEWVVMRNHPQLAYEMLHSIEYLRPALDIPYCHHEKWDGTGYPRGLKGEQIPFAARLFALADVYDALTSDRPYRKAWTRERTLHNIREQAGKHFDPRVVKAFLTLLQTGELRQIY